MTAGSGATVDGGTLTIANHSDDQAVTPAVTIAFDNADLFSSVTLSANAGGPTSTATYNPTTTTESITFVFDHPLVIPAGGVANYNLSVTVTSNPQMTMRSRQFYYAGIAGMRRGSSGQGWLALLAVLSFINLGAAGLGGARRRRVLALVILIVALASQVGCDTGTLPDSNLTPSSTQTATSVFAASTSGQQLTVVGLPQTLSTITLGE